MRSTALPSLLLASLSLGAGLAACTKAPAAPSAVRTDSAGIEIVMNSGVDQVLDWSVLPSDTLLDPEVDSTLQGEAKWLNITVDGQGRLAFADDGFKDPRVFRRSDDGTLHLVGRRGAGPGEYGAVGAISASPSGELLALDYAKRGLLRFAADDSDLPTIPFSTFGAGWAQAAAFVGGGIAALMEDYTDSLTVKQLSWVTSTDTTRLLELRDAGEKLARFESCNIGMAVRPMFSPNPLWTGNDTLIAVAATDRYEIEIWRGGRHIRSIRRDRAPRAATEALATQELGEGRRVSIGTAPSCLIPAEEFIAKNGVAPTIPAYKRLTMTRDGTIWAARYTVKGEPPQRDIFDPTGTYLGTVTGDIAWPQAWFPNGEFVSVLANADSLPVVVRYGVGMGIQEE